MNVPVADVQNVSEPLVALYERGDRTALTGYTKRCLRKVRRMQHIS